MTLERRLDYYSTGWLRRSWLTTEVARRGVVWVIEDDSGLWISDESSSCIVPVWPSENQASEWAKSGARPLAVAVGELAQVLSERCGSGDFLLELWPRAAGKVRVVHWAVFLDEVRSTGSGEPVELRAEAFRRSPSEDVVGGWRGSEVWTTTSFPADAPKRLEPVPERERLSVSRSSPWARYRYFHGAQRRPRRAAWVAARGDQIVECLDPNGQIYLPVWPAEGFVPSELEMSMPATALAVRAAVFRTAWLEAAADRGIGIAVFPLHGAAILVSAPRLALDLADEAPPIPRRGRQAGSM